MANVILTDIELDAEKLLSIFTKAQKAAPAALAALGVLATGIDKALSDVAAGAANPTTLTISLNSDATDIKAVWPEVVAFLGTLGIKL
jgi:thiamine monophosphate kinase